MEMTELKYGMQPFWFWNGKMDPEEIKRQIREMKEKGIPGFFIHPRQGMELPYMSQEYFDRVKLAVETAKELDMEVWIYDEYPYPSGVCGGEVILDHPEYLCKRLRRVTKDAEGGQKVRLSVDWGKVILARAYRVQNGQIVLDDCLDLKEYVGTGYRQEVFQYSGLTKYNKKRYFTGDPEKLLCWTAPEGTWRIYLVTEVVFNHFKYFENFVDPLNPEAVRYFISLTHERYKKHVGEEFGKTIKGFFTDEVTAFPDSEPWSPLLPQAVMERHGIDLIQYLPALWENLGEITSRVRYAYWNTATELFIESYDKQVYQWCEENHLLYAGEKPIMRSKELKYVHIPGIDAGHQKAGSRARMIEGKYRSNGKMVSSAAHFYHKPSALCEVGHSVGWGMTMQDMKWMLDWLAVQGIDFFVIHGFFFTTDGLKKHDAPPSPFFQMPWWQDAQILTSYAKKLGELLHSVKKEVKVLLVDPVTSAWTSSREEAALLKDGFARLQNRLLYEGIEYYIVDPELLKEAQVVTEQGKVSLSIGGEAYEYVVLPPMRNLEEGACRTILKFSGAGGKIGAMACVPFEQIEDSLWIKDVEKLFDVDGEALWNSYKEAGNRESVCQSREKGSCYYGADEEEIVQWLRRECPPLWTITPLDELGKEGLPCISGVDEQGAARLFLVNTTSQKRRLEIKSPKGQIWQMELEGLESRAFSDGKLPALLDGTEASSVIETESAGISLEEPMKYTLGSLNALRLGFWDMILPDGQVRCVETAPFIDQLESGDFLRPVRQKKYFGCPKELAFEGTSAEFRITFDCDEHFWEAKRPVYLVMEPETFLGDWTIRINDRCIREQDFVQKELYLPTNLAVEVTDALLSGENQILVTVDTEVSYGGMRNPLYLMGQFRTVWDQERKIWQLSSLLETCSLRDLTAAGLPFYYGELRFEKEIPAIGCKGDLAYLKLSDPWLDDSVRIRIGDYETAPCAWRPYVFAVPAQLVRQEPVKLTVLVRNTALGLFEGQRFNRKEHRYEDVKAK